MDKVEKYLKYESMDAHIMSISLHGKSATIFKYLDVGDKFKFPKSDEVLKKISNSSYSDEKGKKFKTGLNSSVIKMGNY